MSLALRDSSLAFIGPWMMALRGPFPVQLSSHGRVFSPFSINAPLGQGSKVLPPFSHILPEVGPVLEFGRVRSIANIFFLDEGGIQVADIVQSPAKLNKGKLVKYGGFPYIQTALTHGGTHSIPCH